MSISSMMAIRRRILGVALRNARTARARTLEDLAKVLQCAPERLSGYERGEQDISMPELEALAAYLCLPTESLLSGELPTDDGKDAQTPAVRKLRDRIIGALVRKARQSAGKSLEDTAARLGCTVGELQAYERGRTAVPVACLVELSEFLGAPLGELAGQPSEAIPAEVVEQPEATAAPMGHLSAEMMAFLSDPANLSYVSAAMALARLAKTELRGFAEALMNLEVQD